MLVECSGEFHHVDGFFANYFGEFGVGADEPFVLRVLEFVLFDVFPELFGGFGAGKFLDAEEIGKSRREFESGLGDGFLFLGGFGGLFGFGFFFAAAKAGFFDVSGFGVVGVVFGVELIEGAHNDVAIREVGAREKGFAETGFASSEMAVATDGRARWEIFGAVNFFPFFRDVDDPFALRVFGTTEKGAKAAVANDHG